MLNLNKNKIDVISHLSCGCYKGGKPTYVCTLTDNC